VLPLRVYQVLAGLSEAVLAVLKRRYASEKREVRKLAKRTVALLNRKAVREFIKENARHVTQVESTFYVLLEQKVRRVVLGAIVNNGSRKRLTRYELLGGGGSGLEL